MKIIEALKKLKYLEQKSADLKDKISANCAYMDYETPIYPDMKDKVSGWIQAYKDLLNEISTLSYRLQKTNLSTFVKIELDGVVIEKSIFEWIIRRKKLIPMEVAMYRKISDKGYKEGMVSFPYGNTAMATFKRYYDPKEKEKRQELLTSEPYEIDAKLEVINAITDLLE